MGRVAARRALRVAQHRPKWKSEMKGITEQAGRDCKAYKLARNYMLGLPGVTDKVLQRYLSIPLSDTPSTMAEVFLRLLLSLRNKGMMATVIPAEFVHSLGRVLNSFDPVTATQRFTSADDLLDNRRKTQPGRPDSQRARMSVAFIRARHALRRSIFGSVQEWS